MKSSEAIPLYIVRFMRLDDYQMKNKNYIRKSDAEKLITANFSSLTIAGFIMKFNYR